MDREIVYKLRIVSDPQAASVLRDFGKMLGGAGGGGRATSGGGASPMAGMLKDVGKLGDAFAKSGKVANDSLDKQMAKVNEAFQKRMRLERETSDRNIADIDKQIAAFNKAEKKKADASEREAKRLTAIHDREEKARTAAAEREQKRQTAAAEQEARRRAEAESRESDRQHDRHRQRQRSIAGQNRSNRAAAAAQQESLDELPGYVGGGAVNRPAGMGAAAGSRRRNWGGMGRDAMGAALDIGHGAALSGLVGTSGQSMMNGLFGIESGYNVARGLVKAGPLGAGVAAAAGAGLGMVSAGGFARDVGQFGFMGGSKPGSYNSWMGDKMAQAGGAIGGAIESAGFSSGAFSGLVSSNKAAAKAEKDLAQAREATARTTAIAAADAERDFANMQGRISTRETRNSVLLNSPMGRATRGAELGANQDLQRAVIAERREANDDYAAAGTSANGEAQRAGALQRQIAAQQKLVELARQEQQLMHSLTDELTDQRDLYLEMARTAGGKLKDAKVNFGNLSPDDQDRAIKLKRQVDEAEKWDRLTGAGPNGRSRQGDAIRNRMTNDDRALLSSVGTSAVERGVTKGALASADRGRFDQFFGNEERNQVRFGERAAQNMQKLAVAIQPKMDVEVNISPNQKELVDAITARVLSEVEKLNKLVQMDTDRQLKERLVAQNQGRK